MENKRWSVGHGGYVCIIDAKTSRFAINQYLEELSLTSQVTVIHKGRALFGRHGGGTIFPVERKELLPIWIRVIEIKD
jgi:hypothetical protein